MAILKSPPIPPKNETLQIRVEEQIKAKLHRYAEFINSSDSYVVSEALRLLFRKDDEFKTWLEGQPQTAINKMERAFFLKWPARHERCSGPVDNAAMNAATGREKSEKSSLCVRESRKGKRSGRLEHVLRQRLGRDLPKCPQPLRARNNRKQIELKRTEYS